MMLMPHSQLFKLPILDHVHRLIFDNFLDSIHNLDHAHVSFQIMSGLDFEQYPRLIPDPAG